MFTLRKLANKQGHISNVSHKFILNTNLVLLYTKYVIKRYMIKPLVLSRLYIVAINVARNCSWIFWWRFGKGVIWPRLSRIFDQNLLPWDNRKWILQNIPIFDDSQGGYQYDQYTFLCNLHVYITKPCLINRAVSQMFPTKSTLQPNYSYSIRNFWSNGVGYSH